MKVIHTFIKFLILVFFFTGYSLKAEWQNINHYYTTFNLHSIFAFNLNYHIIIHDGGNYMKTTNGGVNYTFGQIGFNQKALKIRMLNENYYIALTNSGIYKTENGGNLWFSINIPSYPCKDIEVINDSLFYLCTKIDTLSKFYKTTNGGINWIQMNCPSRIDNLFFLNELTGYSAFFKSAYNTIWETTDGAVTWTAIPGPGEFFEYIYPKKVIRKKIFLFILFKNIRSRYSI